MNRSDPGGQISCIARFPSRKNVPSTAERRLPDLNPSLQRPLKALADPSMRFMLLSTSEPALPLCLIASAAIPRASIRRPAERTPACTAHGPSRDATTPRHPKKNFEVLK